MTNKNCRYYETENQQLITIANSFCSRHFTANTVSWYQLHCRNQSITLHHCYQPGDYRVIFSNYHKPTQLFFSQCKLQISLSSPLTLLRLPGKSRLASSSCGDKWHGFLWTKCLPCHLTNSVKTLKGTQNTDLNNGKITHWSLGLLREKACFLYTGSLHFRPHCSTMYIGQMRLPPSLKQTSSEQW